jgi:hypothetical protein
MKSVVLKSTVLDNEHSSFISSFDKKYEDIIDTFKEKLPLMNQQQLTQMSKRLDDAYKDFVGKGDWSISYPDTKINVDFKKENLDLVIEKLTSIHIQLQSIN